MHHHNYCNAKSAVTIEAQEGTVNPAKGISTFFAMETTPARFRSKRITTQDGRVFMVPTIRDVVAWSQTAYGGKQQEVALDMPAASACDIGGLCE